MAYENISNLYGSQAAGSQFAGLEAANLADPFRNERGAYQNHLRTLMANPGSIASSPTYQFAFDQGMDAINRRAAATGRANSGNVLGELTRFGQGLAGQQFFNQANLLALLSGATTGSPAAAGSLYQGGINRSQDQNAIAAAGRNLGDNRSRLPLGKNPAQELMDQIPIGTGGRDYGLPSGGYGIPAPVSPYTGPGYIPSSEAGTGWMLGNNFDASFGGGNTTMFDIGAGGGFDPPFSLNDFGGSSGGFDTGGYDFDTSGYDYGGEY